MKKYLFYLFVAALVFINCGNTVIEQRKSDLKQFQDKPVSVVWNNDVKDGIQSYQANVLVYSMDSRHDTHASLSSAYRIAVKQIDGSIVSRVDLDLGPDMPFRSFIANDKEAIAFNPDTGEINSRLAIENVKPPLYHVLEQQCGVSRVNLSLLRGEANRLSLNITEDTASNTLMIEIPPERIPQDGVNNVTRSRAAFNLSDGTLQETEMVMVREDGTIVTAVTTPVYENNDGIPVKIATMTVIDSKAPELIEGDNSDVQIYESPDDIPELTESQFAEMNETGNIHEMPQITFGNPADLSYTQTIYEIYQDIQINSVPENLFRIVRK